MHGEETVRWWRSIIKKRLEGRMEIIHSRGCNWSLKASLTGFSGRGTDSDEKGHVFVQKDVL
jgi:hypothetical protein